MKKTEFSGDLPARGGQGRNGPEAFVDGAGLTLCELAEALLAMPFEGSLMGMVSRVGW